MMTEYQRAYCRERNRFRRSLKICTCCGKEPAREGKSLGVNCKARQVEAYRRRVRDKVQASA